MITSLECSLSKGNFVGIGFVILNFNSFYLKRKEQCTEGRLELWLSCTQIDGNRIGPSAGILISPGNTGTAVII